MIEEHNGWNCDSMFVKRKVLVSKNRNKYIHCEEKLINILAELRANRNILLKIYFNVKINVVKFSS